MKVVFTMIKNDLREHGCVIEEKSTKRYVVNILCITFSLLMIGCAIILPYIIRNVINSISFSRHSITIVMNSAMIPMCFFQLIFFVFLYFLLKFALTWLFCSDRYNNIKLKFLEDYNLPVCHCREAFTVWQTVVIYIIPVILVYISMFWISVTITGEPFQAVDSGFMTMLFFMSIFMAFDVALVACVLYNKIRYKIDYVAIDYHMFRMTFYKEIYLLIDGKREKSRIKITANRTKKRMFTKMTTCLNPECENYVKELEKSVKKCPSCGAKIYLAEVLPDMVTCTDNECENYGHELKQEVEICSSCGRRTQPLAFIFNPRLALPSVITSVSTLIIFAFADLYMSNYGILFEPVGDVIDIPNIVKGLLFLISIVMGVLSKRKAAIIIPIICLLLSSVLANYIFSFM